MNRKEWYESYREARYLAVAVAIRAIDNGLMNDPAYCVIYDMIKSKYGSNIHYAIINRHKRTYYNIQENKWAISHNHRF